MSSRATSKATNKPASVELANARESTHRRPQRVGNQGHRASARPRFSSSSASLLSSLPPAPQHFIVYFRFESDELTDESRALVPDILQAVKDRPVPDVVVIGHTDTTGTPPSNLELGLKRATMVRALLVDAGLDPTSVEVASHGEADLLVQTADDIFEPRNRRVEITVR